MLPGCEAQFSVQVPQPAEGPDLLPQKPGPGARRAPALFRYLNLEDFSAGNTTAIMLGVAIIFSNAFEHPVKRNFTLSFGFYYQLPIYNRHLNYRALG